LSISRFPKNLTKGFVHIVQITKNLRISDPPISNR
jgi:hypothetical protein